MCVSAGQQHGTPCASGSQLQRPHAAQTDVQEALLHSDEEDAALHAEDGARAAASARLPARDSHAALAGAASSAVEQHLQGAKQTAAGAGDEEDEGDESEEVRVACASLPCALARAP